MILTIRLSVQIKNSRFLKAKGKTNLLNVYLIHYHVNIFSCMCVHWQTILIILNFVNVMVTTKTPIWSFFSSCFCN